METDKNQTRCFELTDFIYRSITEEQRQFIIVEHILTVDRSIEIKLWATVLDKEEGADLHLGVGVGVGVGGLYISLTFTEMVYLLPHSCLLSRSEVNDLKNCM